MSQRLLLVAGLALIASCGTPAQERQSDRPPGVSTALPEPPRPWTSSFERSALLVADEVRVEGPKGLLDHIATRIEPEHHVYGVETVAEGFRQTFTPRDPNAGIEMRAYLDGLELVAVRRLVLLERPGDVDVVVQGTGDAYWRETASGREQRGDVLRFVGERPR